jgi:hypothetical protein
MRRLHLAVVAECNRPHGNRKSTHRFALGHSQFREQNRRSCAGITPPHDHHDVLAAEFFQFVDGAAAGASCARRRANSWRRRARRFRRPARGFLGRLEERPDVDVEAEVGIAVATTLAPRSCPSWPSLAMRMRGRRPSRSAKSSVIARTSPAAFGLLAEFGA